MQGNINAIQFNRRKKEPCNRGSAGDADIPRVVLRLASLERRRFADECKCLATWMQSQGTAAGSERGRAALPLPQQASRDANLLPMYCIRADKTTVCARPCFPASAASWLALGGPWVVRALLEGCRMCGFMAMRSGSDRPWLTCQPILAIASGESGMIPEISRRA